MRIVGDAFMQRHSVKESLLNNYVDMRVLELIDKKGYNQKNLLDESAAWTIDNLASWLHQQKLN